MDAHGQGLFVKPKRRGTSALAGDEGEWGDFRYHRSHEEEGAGTESLDSEEGVDRDIQPFLQQQESHRPGKGSIEYKEEIFEENKLPKSLSDMESSYFEEFKHSPGFPDEYREFVKQKLHNKNKAHQPISMK